MDKDQIVFVVASDVHLGFKQNSLQRVNDSFDTLSQVFEISRQVNADFILLAGDLFDIPHPSIYTFKRVIDILKQTVCEQRNQEDMRIIISKNQPQLPQYITNPKLKVSRPVFTIHGNHDYPCEEYGTFGSCDFLHQTHFLTYFGKYFTTSKQIVKPIIFSLPNSKTKIALYGIGYMKDQKLNKKFFNNQIQFEKPVTDDQYFCLLVIHQNRYRKNFRAGAGPEKFFIPTNIPEWMDLTIWGHEHQTKYQFQYEAERKIIQIGSTIATQNIKAESIRKQCLQIKVKYRDCKITSHLLKSVRPLFVQEINLKNQIKKDRKFNLKKNIQEIIQQFLLQSLKINTMKPLMKVKILVQQHNKQLQSSCNDILTKYQDKICQYKKVLKFLISKHANDNKKKEKQNQVYLGQPQIKENQSYVNFNQQIISQGFQKINLKYYDKQILKKLMINGLQVQNQRQQNDIIQKLSIYMINSSEKSIEKHKKLIIKAKQQIQIEYNKAMMYWEDRFRNLSIQELGKKWGVSTRQQFMKLQQNLMQQQTLQKCYNYLQQGNLQQIQNILIKLRRQTVINKRQNNHIRYTQNTASKQKENIKQERQRSMHERDSSQDCCQKVARMAINPNLVKKNFQFAVQKIDFDNNKGKFLQKQKNQKIKQKPIKKQNKKTLQDFFF